MIDLFDDPGGAARVWVSDRRDFESQIVILLPRLRRFAIRLARSVEEGEDLLQAACLKALEHWQQWDPGTRLDSWTYRIIQTTWLDRRKSATWRLVDFDTVAAGEGSGPVATTAVEQGMLARLGMRPASAGDLSA